MERIDLVVEVLVETKRAERLWQHELPIESPTGAARARVQATRVFARQSRNQRTSNARLSGAELQAAVRLAPTADRLLRDAVERWSFSARAVHRTLRVARTISDLAAADAIGDQSVAEALSMRHETLRQ